MRAFNRNGVFSPNKYKGTLSRGNVPTMLIKLSANFVRNCHCTFVQALGRSDFIWKILSYRMDFVRCILPRGVN